MRKALLYLIPILILAVFVIFMNSGPYLKKPIGEEDNVAKYIKLLKEDIENENWDSARSHVGKLELAWQNVIPRVQYILDKDEIINLNESIARMNGSILAMDKTMAKVELVLLEYHWKRLGE